MTARSTRCRHRHRDGLIVLGDIVLPEIPLVEVLVASGKLDPNLADSKDAVTEAVRQLLTELTAADVYLAD